MPEANTPPTLPELESALARLTEARYGAAADPSEAQALAAEAGDVDYLLARIRCLEAALALASDDVSWIAPSGRSTPAQSLQRIKAQCALFPELFNAMFAVAATHQSVSREMLALAIKQFRRDTDNLGKDDLVSLLVSIANGGNQAFEAVLRTRKGADRKAAALPWGQDRD